MKTIVFFREGDQEIVDDYLHRFSAYSDEELVAAYNREVKTGIVGVRRQMLYLYSLRLVMRDRFKSSPIYCESNIMGLQGEVQLVDGKLWFK